MSKRGPWGPRERPPRKHRTGRAPARAAAAARHCFVDEAQPSRLVEWRQGVAGSEGRVIPLRRLEGEGWAVVEQWVGATGISPGE